MNVHTCGNLAKKLSDISVILGNTTRAMDFLLAAIGIKAASRLGVFDHEVKPLEQLSREYQLFMTISEFRVRIMDGDRGVSDKGISTAKNEGGGMRFAYISKEEKTAYMAALYEVRGDHESFGKLMGYPVCCTEFFKQEFPKRSKLDNNYEIPILDNSKGSKFHSENNIFLRDQDVVLISHFPCSLACEESSRIGVRNRQMFKNSEIYDRLKGTFSIRGRQIEFI